MKSLLTLDPKDIRIYVNTAKKTIAQVQKETGADLVINGTLFNSNWTACQTLKADGKLVAVENEPYLGFAWNKGDKMPIFTTDHSSKENFFCCVPLVQDGKKLNLWYNKDMGGARGRTAFATTADDKVVIFCSNDGTDGKTPEALQHLIFEEGCKDAIMLDGGGSSQMIYTKGSQQTIISSSRIVHNFICIWERKMIHRVQLGAFQDRTNAEKLSEELGKLGYTSYIVSSEL